MKSGSRKTERVGTIITYDIMKKQEVKSALKFKKSVVSNFSITQIKGGIIRIESVDRLYCETEDCVTQNCITALYSNCNQCGYTSC